MCASGRFLEKCLSSYGKNKYVALNIHILLKKITFYEKIKRSFSIGYKIPFHMSTNGKDGILCFVSSEVKNSVMLLLYDKSGILNIFGEGRPLLVNAHVPQNFLVVCVLKNMAVALENY